MADLELRPELERAPAGTIRAAQDTLLKRHVAYVAEHSPFYRRAFARAGVDLAAFRGLIDLPLLPLTRKEELEREGDQFLCVAQNKLVDVCLTSGTTASPVAIRLTAQDLERLCYNEERSFDTAGIEPGMKVLIGAALDRCFMAGLAYFLGLTRLGCQAIRAGSSSLSVMAELVKSERPRAAVGVPTLFLALGNRLLEQGLDPASMGVELMVLIGEPLRAQDFSLSPLGERLREMWGSKLRGTYASTEMATAFTDCSAGSGGHLRPDLLAVEILDERGNPAPPGTPGEVAATPLQVTGMPLVRYLTGDIAVLYEESCACGRTTPRLGPIMGRKAQALKFKGTTVYPPAIFAALQEIESVRGAYVEVYDHFELAERIRVVVGVAGENPGEAGIAERIAARIRVKPEVVLADPDEVARKITVPGKRKPVNFFDYRKNSPGPGGPVGDSR